MDIDFNTFFKISVTAMRFNRAHPDIPRDLKWLFQFVLMHGLFTFVFVLVLYSTIFIDYKEKNFTKTCENSVIAFLYVLATFWYIASVWNQKSLVLIIATIQKDYFAAKDLPSDEKTMLMEYANKGLWNVKLWLGISGGVALMFPLRSVCLMVYYAITGNIQLVPVYEVTYPEFMEKTKNNPACFILVYAAMLWYCAYGASFFVGLVPLGPIFMLHTCGQLSLVKKRADTLFPNIHYDSKETEKNLKGIAKHLQEIYCFVEHVQMCFKLIYELCMRGTTWTVPVLIYELCETTKNGEFSMEFLTITVGCIVISTYPCYYGDLLMELGNSVRQSLYCSGWERHWDKRARSLLLMILIRTARPLVIRSMFGIMSLSALANTGSSIQLLRKLASGSGLVWALTVCTAPRYFVKMYFTTRTQYTTLLMLLGKDSSLLQ